MVIDLKTKQITENVSTVLDMYLNKIYKERCKALTFQVLNKIFISHQNLLNAMLFNYNLGANRMFKTLLSSSLWLKGLPL